LSRNLVFLRSRSLASPAEIRSSMHAPTSPPTASNTMDVGVASIPPGAYNNHDGRAFVGALLPADPDSYLDGIEISLSDSPVDVASDDSKDGGTHSPTGS
jgi:hypothetical protein